MRITKERLNAIIAEETEKFRRTQKEEERLSEEIIDQLIEETIKEELNK